MVPQAAREAIRAQYSAKRGVWGPAVLAHWARREGLGSFSPSTISRLVADLRPAEPPPPSKTRYEVMRPMALWSEDGATFRERGRKHELLLVQDECSRLKVAGELVRGSADGGDVRRTLQEAFGRYGAPLVLKRDGGSVFAEDGVERLLEQHGVVSLTSPPATPRYNGRCERAVRDVRTFERALRAEGVSLGGRIHLAMTDLNDERPRPVLGGRTAREVHEPARGLPDRHDFRDRVAARRAHLIAGTTTRTERRRAERRAVEDVLAWYGLIEWKTDVSTHSESRRGPN